MILTSAQMRSTVSGQRKPKNNNNNNNNNNHAQAWTQHQRHALTKEFQTLLHTYTHYYTHYYVQICKRKMRHRRVKRDLI